MSVPQVFPSAFYLQQGAGVKLGFAVLASPRGNVWSIRERTCSAHPSSAASGWRN